jgi:hypothetical protein
MVTKYQKRISGPLLDRIDIHIEVPRVDYEKLSGTESASHPNRFAKESRLQETFNKPDLPIPNLPTSFPTPTCASGKSANFVSCRMKVRV